MSAMLSQRPLVGVDAVLDGRVLRRQAEGVPAHGVQHVVALHALVAGDHVADGVVAHVAHVELARRVGEHLQAVVLGPGGISTTRYRWVVRHTSCHLGSITWGRYSVSTALTSPCHRGAPPRPGRSTSLERKKPSSCRDERLTFRRDHSAWRPAAAHLDPAPVDRRGSRRRAGAKKGASGRVYAGPSARLGLRLWGEFPPAPDRLPSPGCSLDPGERVVLPPSSPQPMKPHRYRYRTTGAGPGQ